MKESNSPPLFYLVSEGPREVNGRVDWYCEVRHGVYPQTVGYEFPRDKTTLEQGLKTKELDGYILVSETNYSSVLDNNWLIAVGLREPLHK